MCAHFSAPARADGPILEQKFSEQKFPAVRRQIFLEKILFWFSRQKFPRSWRHIFPTSWRHIFPQSCRQNFPQAWGKILFRFWRQKFLPSWRQKFLQSSTHNFLRWRGPFFPLYRYRVYGPRTGYRRRFTRAIAGYRRASPRAPNGRHIFSLRKIFPSSPDSAEIPIFSADSAVLRARTY